MVYSLMDAQKAKLKLLTFTDLVSVHRTPPDCQFEEHGRFLTMMQYITLSHRYR
jgi:hypothetical protein